MEGRPSFAGETSAKIDDLILHKKLVSFIRKRGIPNRGPVLSSVLSCPEVFGLKNFARTELIKIVWNSLERLGFVGRPEDIQFYHRFERVLKTASREDGGF